MIERIIDYCARNKFIVFLFLSVGLAVGFWSMQNIGLDAIPDLSDTQVIVYSRWDRSPDIIEDQVTYPIVTSMLGAPRVKAIRGFSDFGFSYVYIIFEEGTDIYWARSRTLEYLSKIIPRLPEGVRTELGPDATGVGWVFQYALMDTTGQNSLADLRSYQDWYLRYYLQSVPGVAEVAALGGFVRQYQVNVNPNALLAYGVSTGQVVDAVRKGNNDVGGRLIEFSGREYMVRGRGYIRSKEDIAQIVVGVNEKTGTPVLVKNVATVALGPDLRRGVGEHNGKGEAVGGIVVMRQGENALKVIDRVKAKLEEIKPSLPPGVTVVTTYDRAMLIEHSIDTLKETLKEELIVVSLVILLFLSHIPSAIIPIFTLPAAVVLSFIPMKIMGVSANIMSLAGIAVAIGAMIDAAVVVVEQTHKKLEHWEAGGRKEDYREVIITAVKEVGRPSFFSLMVIAVSFLPIFTLEAQEGRLFKPLAFTKNFSMAIAAVLAITLDPAMRLLFTHMREFSFRPRWLARSVNAILVGKIRSEDKHPISRRLFKVYMPVCRFVLRHPWQVIGSSVLLFSTTFFAYHRLGSEFMPPLNEGVILYMPTTLPGISVTEATRLLQTQDKILMSFPEVESVHGKSGRAETSTDPAPFSMMETVVTLKPQAQWRPKHRWYSSWAPQWLASGLRRAWPDRISWDELIYGEHGLDQALRFPGVTNAWTMPVKNRIDMLTTGVRTPVGIKVFGQDLGEIEKIGQHIEAVLKDIRGTRSVYAERVTGGYFIDFDLKREELARYGLTIDDAQMTIMSAVGGENVTTTVEGKERYPVNVRYLADFRTDPDRLSRVLISTPTGAQIPIAQVADIRLTTGPAMIRNENGLLAGYIYVDVAGRDLGGWVNEAKSIVRDKIKLPTGYTIGWSGQYEFLERVFRRLSLVVPLTIILVFVLIYFNTRSLAKTAIVFLAVPFSAIGAIWLLYALGYHMSIGVWVGLIALLGVDAETGIFMLLYLDLAYEDARKKGLMRDVADLNEAILHGAVLRVRPKLMTVACAFVGLMPIMWSTGTGADVMKRIAAPMVGGLFTSFLMELLVYPAIYLLWRWHFHVKKVARGPALVLEGLNP
jgi:Cu(I)/Ag(I) efflux system membrane protein CusA/SilA